MVCGFGLMVASSPEGAAIQKQSLLTLKAFQTRLGNMPHNVGFTGIPDPALIAHGGALKVGEDEEPIAIPDTAHSGCIDNSLWYIIGNYYTYKMDGDIARLAGAWESVKRAYTWLDYQDSNECGLLEVHEAKDWADLFANRYNTLGPNVLWFAAQKCMAEMAAALGEDGSWWASRVEDIKYKMNTLLWVGPESSRDLKWVERHRKEWLYPIKATDIIYQDRPYYLPYMGFREWEDRFDSFGNLVAVFFGMANQKQSDRIFDYITAYGVDQPWPIRAINPVVRPGDKDWREYYRLRNLNLPHQYHNGGIWPFIGGFYVAALVKAGRLEQAKQQLERLAEMNRQSRYGGEWEFNEWCHGESGKPSGFPGQSWSAAMYLFAHECVKRGEVPVFNPSNGW